MQTIEENTQEHSGGAQLPLSFRFAAFAIPALVGFVLSSLILFIIGPFDSTIELVAWLLIAVLVGFAAASFAAEFVQRKIRNTDAYRNSLEFDTQVDELFGAYLRTGNIRALRKTAVENDLDLKMIDAVAERLDELTRHDRMTRGHTERVRAYASLIGNEMELPQDQLELLNWASMMHDIGKLDVPPNILNKKGKPSPQEWEVLKGHPWAAFQQLNKLEKYFGEAIYAGALYHHERWDGAGYPFGLSKEEIPLLGRITAVADAFDVMTHARSYKTAMPIRQAREELIASSATHFDPAVVEAFVRIGEKELAQVRGWSSAVAGLGLVTSQVGSVFTNLVIATATLIGAGIAVVATSEPPPEAIAFAADEPAETTTTSAVTPEATTTTAAPETTTTSTAAPETTTTTIVETTTTAADTLFTVNYEIGTTEIDGLDATVDADQLIVFVDDVENSRHPLAPGQRLVPVVFNLTELGEGQHFVRFELYDEDELVSVDLTIISG